MMGVTKDSTIKLVNVDQPVEEDKHSEKKNSNAHSRKMAMAGDYQQLKAVYDLQTEIVQEYMHNAMSPISAISGYLELMQMVLQDDIDADRVEKYRTRIEKGIDELSDIIEELYETCDKEGELIEDTIEMNINRRAS